jgi:hypothetical protein
MEQLQCLTWLSACTTDLVTMDESSEPIHGTQMWANKCLADDVLLGKNRLQVATTRRISLVRILLRLVKNARLEAVSTLGC